MAYLKTDVKAFSPLSIAGCVAWFDMQDAASFTNTSGAVSAITNKASAVSWTEATARPAYDATGLNGFPSMLFVSASSQKIISTEAAVYNAFANNNPITIFVVCQNVTVDVSASIFGAGNTGVATNRTKYLGQSTGGSGNYLVQARDDATAVSQLVAAISTSDGYSNVLETYINTTVGTILKNGASTGANGAAFAPGTLTPNNTAIGCRPDNVPDSFYDGKIGEIVIYNSELSTGDRAYVRAGLGTKWSIAVI